MLNNEVVGCDDFGDTVFDGDKDDFDSAAGNMLDPSRESAREIMIAAQFVVFE